jgi:AcrR family transcriptional regulator
VSGSATRAGKVAPQRRGAPVVARVLEVALEELARVGYDGLSVPEVAERAGLNKTSVYRRWPTKRALIGAAVDHAMGHDAPLPDTGSLRSDVLAFALAAAAWGDSPVGRGVLKTLLTAGDEPDVRALVVRWMRTRAKGPRALFARAIARGELDEKADVEMAMNVVAGAISHRILVQSQSVTPVFVNRLIRLVLDGLTANGA